MNLNMNIIEIIMLFSLILFVCCFCLWIYFSINFFRSECVFVIFARCCSWLFFVVHSFFIGVLLTILLGDCWCNMHFKSYCAAFASFFFFHLPVFVYQPLFSLHCSWTCVATKRKLFFVSFSTLPLSLPSRRSLNLFFFFGIATNSVLLLNYTVKNL